MRFFRIIMTLAVAAALPSCYEGYVYDHDVTTAGFSLQKPLRTVVHGTSISIGVSISGKRDVDMSDWAKFTIDASLLEGTGLTLLPSDYYTLGDSEIMKVRRSNIPIADVEISFTEAFYADINAVSTYYALPFRITDTSLSAIREGGESTVAVIKYVSSFSGTYYVMGEVSELSGGTEVSKEIYREKDLNKNFTRDLSTQGPMKISRPGVGKIATGGLLLTLSDTADNNGDRDVTIEASSPVVVITDATGRYVKNGDYIFAGSGKVAPQMELKYTYETGGVQYKVSETLVLRREPEDDLRMETW